LVIVQNKKTAKQPADVIKKSADTLLVYTEDIT